jgi:hypothetical protein
MSHLKNRIDGVMVSVFALSALDRGLEPPSGQTIDNSIGTCCFSAKNAALRKKSKDWLAWNQNNVSECPWWWSVGLLMKSRTWLFLPTGMLLSMQKMGEFRYLEFLDLSFWRQMRLSYPKGPTSVYKQVKSVALWSQ